MAELLDQLIPAPACRTRRPATKPVAMAVIGARLAPENPNGKIERSRLPEVAP